MAKSLSDRKQSVGNRSRLNAYLWPMGVALLVIAAMWGLILSQLADDRKQAISAAETNATNLSRAFEQHVLSTIQHFDSMLIHLREEYLRKQTEFRVSNEDAFWRTYGSSFTQLAVIDASGFLVYSSLAPVTTQVDLNDREHFRVQKNSTEDKLFISKPVFGRVSQKWTIQLTRRMQDSDGRFRGVIVMSISPSDLSRLYASIDIGQTGAISLVGTDGVVRAWGSKQPPPVEPIGNVIPADRPFMDPAKPDSGIFQVTSIINGTQRIAAYRRLQAFPLIVVVLLAEDEVMKAWESRTHSVLLVGLLTSAVLLCCALLVGGMLERSRSSRTELVRANAELRALAEIDILTGVRNRQAFMNAAAVEIDRQRRHGRPVSMAMIELDRFKELGERLGRMNADHVMAAVIARCQASLRPHDLIGRYNSDEFAILLPETDLRQAREVMERVRAVIATTSFPVPGFPDQNVTISVGLTANVAGDDVDQMLSRVDLALYQAKEQGRDRSIIV